MTTTPDTSEKLSTREKVAYGFGDFASTMLAEGRGASFRVLERVLFPHSLGIFYAAVTQWLGFPKYGDEGKVMGLAPYGTPRFVDQMLRIVRPKGDVFELDLDSSASHRLYEKA